MMQYLKYWDGAEDAHPQDDGLGLFGAFDSRVIENFDKYQLLLPIDASTNPNHRRFGAVQIPREAMRQGTVGQTRHVVGVALVAR